MDRTIDQQGRKVVAFDPNALNRADAPSARFPLPLDTFGFPDFTRGADEYLQALRAGIGEVAKAVPPIASAYAYAHVAYMPDAANAGLLNWPGMDPSSLRKVAGENLGPRMVFNQRLLDIQRYLNLSSHPWRPGWKIEMMDARAQPTKAIKKDIQDAESFIYNCSRDFDYDEARLRDSHLLSPFSDFMGKFLDDILTFDAWTVWTDPDRMGRIKSFAALPASNIRLAGPKGYRSDPKWFAALIDETHTPVTPFSRDEMFFRVMHPRTDPAVYGYGWPLIEQSILLIQALQGAVQLNSDTFQRNGIPNGMILLQGDYFNQDQIDLLMREWQNAKRGISKAWGVPVLAVPKDGDVKIVELNDLKGEDVRYRDHMNMMTGAFCIVSGFPVKRLGLFASGHHRDNQPSSDQSTEIAGADDPGLPPLLHFAADGLTQYVIWPNWPHLKLVFTNTDPKTDAREYEAKKLARTWRESRAEADLPPLASLFPPWMKEVAEIMELAPEDPNKSSIYQTVAVKALEAKLGLAAGPDEARPGNPMTSKKDPAKSESHGHTSGVRRDSKAESKPSA